MNEELSFLSLLFLQRISTWHCRFFCQKECPAAARVSDKQYFAVFCKRYVSLFRKVAFLESFFFRYKGIFCLFLGGIHARRRLRRGNVRAGGLKKVKFPTTMDLPQEEEM